MHNGFHSNPANQSGLASGGGYARTLNSSYPGANGADMFLGGMTRQGPVISAIHHHHNPHQQQQQHAPTPYDCHQLPGSSNYAFGSSTFPPSHASAAAATAHVNSQLAVAAAAAAAAAAAQGVLMCASNGATAAGPFYSPVAGHGASGQQQHVVAAGGVAPGCRGPPNFEHQQQQHRPTTLQHAPHVHHGWHHQHHMNGAPQQQPQQHQPPSAVHAIHPWNQLAGAELFQRPPPNGFHHAAPAPPGAAAAAAAAFYNNVHAASMASAVQTSDVGAANFLPPHHAYHHHLASGHYHHYPPSFDPSLATAAAVAHHPTAQAFFPPAPPMPSHPGPQQQPQQQQQQQFSCPFLRNQAAAANRLLPARGGHVPHGGPHPGPPLPVNGNQFQHAQLHHDQRGAVPRHNNNHHQSSFYADVMQQQQPYGPPHPAAAAASMQEVFGQGGRIELVACTHSGPTATAATVPANAVTAAAASFPMRTSTTAAAAAAAMAAVRFDQEHQQRRLQQQQQQQHGGGIVRRGGSVPIRGGVRTSPQLNNNNGGGGGGSIMPPSRMQQQRNMNGAHISQQQHMSQSMNANAAMGRLRIPPWEYHLHPPVLTATYPTAITTAADATYPAFLMQFLVMWPDDQMAMLGDGAWPSDIGLDDDNYYEALLDLADRLGEARPRGMTRSQIEKLPSYRYCRPSDNHRDTTSAAATVAAVAGTGCGKDQFHSPPEKKRPTIGTGANQTSCVVCLCDFESRQMLRVLLCNHEFHAKCVDRWLKTNRTCPICRRDCSEMQQQHQANAAAAAAAAVAVATTRETSNDSITSAAAADDEDAPIPMVH